jgi:hypothetical protein
MREYQRQQRYNLRRLYREKAFRTVMALDRDAVYYYVSAEVGEGLVSYEQGRWCFINQLTRQHAVATLVNDMELGAENWPMLHPYCQVPHHECGACSKPVYDSRDYLCAVCRSCQ